MQFYILFWIGKTFAINTHKILHESEFFENTNTATKRKYIVKKEVACHHTGGRFLVQH